MPRTARASVGGMVYHALNRGNARATVFHDDGDYRAFMELLGLAAGRLPADVFAYCLMPNHFHLVVRPVNDGELGRWMQWLMTSHVRRHHRRHGGSGHVWQGRFKAFPVQSDGHWLSVLAYVERNPLRARLVKRVQDWPWSSARWRGGRGGRGGRPAFLTPGPPDEMPHWIDDLNAVSDEAELAAIRASVVRGAPYGDPAWIGPTAVALGLESTLRPRGRPRKEPEK